MRTAADAEHLLQAGADKVAVNTAAVGRPQLVPDLADRFGAQCTVVSVDAARLPRAGRWWSRVVRYALASMWANWSHRATQLGAGEVLVTSWDRDGTGLGYDLDLIESVAGSVSVPVIASGGAADPRHLVEAVKAGASAVLVASMLTRRRLHGLRTEGCADRGENRGAALIIPSIDIRRGQAVQLVSGETVAVEAGHPGR